MALLLDLVTIIDRAALFLCFRLTDFLPCFFLDRVLPPTRIDLAIKSL